MDDSIVTGNIGGEVRKLSKGLFADDGIVDEILTELTLVFKGSTGEVGQVGATDCAGRDHTRNDTVTAQGGVEWSVHGLVRFDGSVSGSKDSEWTRSRKGCGNTGRLESLAEKAKVIVSFELTLFLSDSDTLSSPNLSRSLERGKGVNDVWAEGGGHLVVAGRRKGRASGNSKGKCGKTEHGNGGEWFFKFEQERKVL